MLKYSCDRATAAEMIAGGQAWRSSSDIQSSKRQVYTPPPPLDWNVVRPMISCLDLPIDETGRDTTTPRELWHREGMDDTTIDRFRLGFCPNVHTAWNPDEPDRRHPGLSIPIWEEDTGVLVNVRYRLLGRTGHNRYRPHKTGLGVHLYDAWSISHRPDGSERPIGNRDALIVAGEKKKDVLERFGLGWMLGIVSATGGCGAWLKEYGDRWEPLLDTCSTIYLCFDPGEEDAMEETAWRFGKRAVPVYLPQVHPDDFILTYPTGTADGVDAFLERVYNARPLRQGGFWDLVGG